ncbi:mitochondrial fission 1 protein-like [Lycorma delicatula]|uniref:mitochondrial fission 1 protein-like n=1 Tax=Lycorma delicatula TaxID=130591 RepID=UPI003F510FFD
MEEVLDEVVPLDDLQKFERAYLDQLYSDNVTRETQFNYAWCLVRSKFPADIRKGLLLLEELFKKDSSEEGKRDYLYYLAVGNAKIKEYSKALQFVRAFLHLEPSNKHVQNLEAVIKKRMEQDGMKGIAIAGTMILAIGGILTLILALSRGK